LRSFGPWLVWIERREDFLINDRPNICPAIVAGTPDREVSRETRQERRKERGEGRREKREALISVGQAAQP
jgi:hypothetical protein